jgi:hypothetical protein
VAATDISGLYDAAQQRQRERAVKVAHFEYITDKLQRCYLYNGIHNFKHHCRHLMEEFKQTKDELLGWKEDARVRVLIDYLFSSSLFYECDKENSACHSS